MDFDRICELKTPASVRCLEMEDLRGAPVCVVVAKVGFRVTQWGASKLTSVPVRITSVDWGARGSLRYPSDYAAQKPGTDVVMIATAYPPAGPPVTGVDVSLRVGPLQKTLRVHGPRVYYQGVMGGVMPGPPARLDPTPLQYENAYGGLDSEDGGTWEPRIPSGVGFALNRARLAGTPAHAIEDPSVPMPARVTTPAGFGPIPAWWEPRRRLAGTFDDRWSHERAPVAPIDQDPRHASFASPGLWSREPLAGDEPVEVIGATSEPVWRFRLPRYEPLFGYQIRGERRAVETHLDTFYIDVEERRVELTWRAAIVLPRKRELIERIFVVGKDKLPDSLFSEAGYQPPAQEASA